MFEKYRYGVDKWWSCRYNLAIDWCSRCLFENLCLFEHNQELWKAIVEANQISEKDWLENTTKNE